MAGQTTWNKATTPAGTDPWNGVPDWKKGLETLNGIVPVANATERDALAPPGGKYAGMTVFRTDLGFMETWDGAAWLRVGGSALGGRVVRAGVTGSFAANTWTVLNNPGVWAVETPAVGLATFSGVWTITTPGEYDVEGGVMIDSSVTATLIIKKNSVSADAAGIMAGATAATGNSFSAATISRRIRCNAGDTLALALIPSGAAKWSDDKLSASFFGLHYAEPLR